MHQHHGDIEIIVQVKTGVLQKRCETGRNIIRDSADQRVAGGDILEIVATIADQLITIARDKPVAENYVVNLCFQNKTVSPSSSCLGLWFAFRLTGRTSFGS